MKTIALLIFITSLIAGDTYYGDLGLTQSLFLIPLLLVYILNAKYLPSITPLRLAGLSFGVILTLQLLFFSFSGIIEWYRTMGGLILAFMVVTLFLRSNIQYQIFWLAIYGLVPVIAYYTGFWKDLGGRMTFLKHDPNHLAHFIIYAFISAIGSLFISKKINKKYMWILTILYFFPLVFTISRTAIITFILVLLVYFVVLLKKQNRLFIIISFISLLILGSFSISDENIILIKYSERFAEKNEQRTNFYKSGYQILSNNFLTGVGISKFENSDWRIENGFFRLEFQKNMLITVSTSTHNGFMDILLIGGIMLFCSFCLIIIYPAYFMYTKTRGLIDSMELRWRKFLVYSFTCSFILMNLTYSLYHSKLGWWGIAYSYLLIGPYYSAKKIKI